MEHEEKIIEMNSSSGRKERRRRKGHTKRCIQLLLVFAFAIAYMKSNNEKHSHHAEYTENTENTVSFSSVEAAASQDYSNNVWLFTSVAADYDGAVLLKQFVHHYIDLGIKPENFLVVINSKSGFRTEEFDKCAKILDNLGIPYHEWLTQY